MKNSYLRCGAIWLFASLGILPPTAGAQVVTTSPAIITADTKNIVITFHADWGNRGMAGLPASTAVYAHTGLITSQSATPDDWTFAPTWPDNSAKYKLKAEGSGTWTLDIPDIRQYYGVPAGVEIKNMVFVFRDAAGSDSQGKTINGGDISLTVFPSGFPAPDMRQYPDGDPQPGATPSSDGSSAIFCFPAPEKNMVQLVGSWNDFAIVPDQQMHYTDIDGIRYFWTSVDGLEAGKDYTYYYIVDGQTAVGDPYARLVLDGNNDKYISSAVYPDMPVFPSEKVSSSVPVAVYNSDAGKYDWQTASFTRPSQESLVLYEVLIRDFTGTEGKANGNGTISGLIDRLDYIKELGVNGIELMPIMEFDGNNSWGYNPNFYFAPDKAYGTPDDYRRLVDECHARGLAVVLDVVFNQTAGLHPWYLMYPMVLSKFYNGTSPHAYSVLNDWNQNNELVQRQFKDVLRYWLTEYKVDGFRFDLVKGLGDNDSYGNTYNEATNTWGTPSGPGTDAYNTSRIARMATLHAAVRDVDPTAYFINEDLAGAEEENALASDGDLNWANINNSACQFAMGYEENSSLSRFFSPSDGGRMRGSTVSYAESHDEERMAYKQMKYGANGVKNNYAMRMRRLGSVAAQMLMTPGPHMIWQFQEFGANQTTKNTDGSNNTNPKLVVWNNLNNANNAGLCQTYRDLLALRDANPELFGNESSATILLNGWAEGRSILLSYADKKLLLAVNPLVDKSIDIFIPSEAGDASSLRLLAASQNTSPVIANGSIALEPGAFAIYGSEDVSSAIDEIPSDYDSTYPIIYYNLQGRQIAAPVPGQIVIRRQGTIADKVIY